MAPPVNQQRYPVDVTVLLVTKETDVIPALTVTMVKHVVSMRLNTGRSNYSCTGFRTYIVLVKCGPNHQNHRLDSNISFDYIAIFLSLISSFYGQHLKI